MPHSPTALTLGVQPGVTRCPYCHDGVSPRTSVVCQDCLARHHPGCWDEASACSSCQSTLRLSPTETRETTTLPEPVLLACSKPGCDETRSPGDRVCLYHAQLSAFVHAFVCQLILTALFAALTIGSAALALYSLQPTLLLVSLGCGLLALFCGATTSKLRPPRPPR